MAILEINGVAVKDPSALNWGISDVSSDESGRSTNDGKAQKDVLAQKRKLEISWSQPTKQEVSTILTAVNYTTVGSFFSVKYPDAMSGNNETRVFYVGDRTAPMRTWTFNNKAYTSLSFSIIEQ